MTWYKLEHIRVCVVVYALPSAIVTLVKSHLNCLFYLCYPVVGDTLILPVSIVFWKNRKATESKEQSADIVGTNLSKIHLVSYNNYAYNGIQEYRMVKGKVPPKCLNSTVTFYTFYITWAALLEQSPLRFHHTLLTASTCTYCGLTVHMYRCSCIKYNSYIV